LKSVLSAFFLILAATSSASADRRCRSAKIDISKIVNDPSGYRYSCKIKAGVPYDMSCDLYPKNTSATQYWCTVFSAPCDRGNFHRHFRVNFYAGPAAGDKLVKDDNGC
jgi:hypothetical protein